MQVSESCGLGEYQEPQKLSDAEIALLHAREIVQRCELPRNQASKLLGQLDIRVICWLLGRGKDHDLTND